MRSYQNSRPALGIFLVAIIQLIGGTHSTFSQEDGKAEALRVPSSKRADIADKKVKLELSLEECIVLAIRNNLA